MRQIQVEDGSKEMNDCQMERWGGCCCNCWYLAKVNLQCSEQREKGYATSKDGCICHIQIGWACIVGATPEMDAHLRLDKHPVVYWWGDSKHGCCECYRPLDGVSVMENVRRRYEKDNE